MTIRSSASIQSRMIDFQRVYFQLIMGSHIYVDTASVSIVAAKNIFMIPPSMNKSSSYSLVAKCYQKNKDLVSNE